METLSKWFSIYAGYVVSAFLVICLLPVFVIMALCVAVGELDQELRGNGEDTKKRG